MRCRYWGRVNRCDAGSSLNGRLQTHRRLPDPGVIRKMTSVVRQAHHERRGSGYPIRGEPVEGSATETLHRGDAGSKQPQPCPLRRWRGCGNDRKSSADPSSPSRPPEICSLFVKLSVSERTVEPYPGFVQPSPPEVPDKEPWNGISSAGRLGP